MVREKKGRMGSPVRSFSSEAVLVLDGDDVPVVLEIPGGVDEVGTAPVKS
jgi:hypothetical protein